MKQFATLRDFVKKTPRGSPGDLAKPLKKVAKALDESGEKGIVQCRILGAKDSNNFCLKLTPGQCSLEIKKIKKPNLELILRDKIAWDLLRGSLSPLEAFRHGKMRIRGDAPLGKRLLKLLASTQDAQFDICETGA
jgi:putative sterol carrier protein